MSTCTTPPRGVCGEPSYEVTAKRWTGGWELQVDGVGVTQVRTLDNAEQQVRDYLETEDENLDASAATIVVTPDLDGLEKEAEQAQHRSEAAQHELIDASMAAASHPLEVRLV